MKNNVKKQWLTRTLNNNSQPERRDIEFYRQVSGQTGYVIVPQW